MQRAQPIDRRGVLKASGLFAVGAGLWPAELLQDPTPGESAGAAFTAAERSALVKGLDGMSRAGDDGFDAFADGHGAAAVLAATFFARDNGLGAATREAIGAHLDANVLTSPLYAPRPHATADPALVAGLVAELDGGIASLRRSGHNVIFAVLALKALQAAPEAATPPRIDGLRRTVRAFAVTRAVAVQDADSFVDPADDARFVHFVFAEYLRALDLYLAGKGHHGFAGHVLTVGHALVELCRLGHAATAQKAVPAFRQFVQQARSGAELGGRRVAEPAARLAAPLEREYWAARAGRSSGIFVDSHLVKYPCSFYALLRDLADAELKQRVLAKLHHLTAVS